MPRLSPFVGLVFDASRVGPLERVTAPPYDAIPPEERTRLHHASGANIVRLILSEERPGDDADRNKYTRASDLLRSWRADGKLVPTDGPRVYPYEMRFRFRGEARSVRGVIAAIDLEPWGGTIMPHERTMAEPVEDRLSLMRAVQTNLSPIYALLGGPCAPLEEVIVGASAADPLAELTDEAGVLHRLWSVAASADLMESVAAERFLIADGHHRYTMALRYREEMRALHGPGPWDSVMMLVVDGATEDPPVLPIHRVLTDVAAPSVGERVRDLEETLALVDDETVTIGTAVWEEGELVHRAGRLHGEPPAVCALHAEFTASLRESHVTYQPDAVAAEEAVRSRTATSAVYLPPTRVERIRPIVERGERLPEKSTYFWPKPRTGMVIRPLDLAERPTSGRPVPAS
ncbi:MAG: DUF1015 family protein [Actinomycetota bacterium]